MKILKIFFIGILLFSVIWADYIYFHFRSTLIQTFREVTQPKQTFKLPCYLQIQLGATGGGEKYNYSTWLEKKDGTKYLLRIFASSWSSEIHPWSNDDPLFNLYYKFNDIRLEVLPSTDINTKLFPTGMHTKIFDAPSSVFGQYPEPINKPKPHLENLVGCGILLQIQPLNQWKYFADYGNPYFETLNLNVKVKELLKEKSPKGILEIGKSATYETLESLIKSEKVGLGAKIDFMVLIFVLCVQVLFWVGLVKFILFIAHLLIRKKCEKCGKPLNRRTGFCGNCGDKS